MKIKIQPVLEIGISECGKYCEGCDYRGRDSVGNPQDSFYCMLFLDDHDDYIDLEAFDMIMWSVVKYVLSGRNIRGLSFWMMMKILIYTICSKRR